MAEFPSGTSLFSNLVSQQFGANVRARGQSLTESPGFQTGLALAQQFGPAARDARQRQQQAQIAIVTEVRDGTIDMQNNPVGALRRIASIQSSFGFQDQAVERLKEANSLIDERETIQIDRGNVIDLVDKRTGEVIESFEKGTNPEDLKLTLQEKINTEIKMKAEFTKAAQTFVERQDAFATMNKLAKDPTGIDDVALITIFNKVLDPRSIVRGEEFDNAANAAGLSNFLIAKIKSFTAGDKLNDTQRKQMLRAARKIYDQARVRQNRLIESTEKVIKNRNLNRENIIFESLTPRKDLEGGINPVRPERAKRSMIDQAKEVGAALIEAAGFGDDEQKEAPKTGRVSFGDLPQ